MSVRFDKPFQHLCKSRIDEPLMIDLLRDIVLDLGCLVVSDSTKRDFTTELHRRSSQPQRMLQPTFDAASKENVPNETPE